MSSILIINNESDVQQTVGLLAALHGFDVICADSIESALQQTENKTFDVCLVDVTLPDGSGLHLVDLLRESQPRVAVLCDAEAVEDVRAGFPGLDTLPKPLVASELLPVLES